MAYFKQLDVTMFERLQAGIMTTDKTPQQLVYSVLVNIRVLDLNHSYKGACIQGFVYLLVKV